CFLGCQLRVNPLGKSVCSRSATAAKGAARLGSLRVVEDKYMSSFPTDGTGEKITLTPAQKARDAARARRGLLVALLSQVLAGLLLSLVLLLVSGWQAGLSALCGSMCYLAPNAIFVARLVLSTFRQTAAGPIVFLLGNGLKVIVAVVLLWALSRIHADW